TRSKRDWSSDVCSSDLVLRAQHQDLSLDLRLGRERNVHRHLVAVEVGVERGADQRMDLDRLALDQDRLERLDAETVERRGAVERSEERRVGKGGGGGGR